MNFDHYHIYLIEGEEQNKIFDEGKDKMQKDHEKRHDWCLSQGGSGALASGESMTGILAEKDAKMEEGWKSITKRGWVFPPHVTYVPDKKTREGKENQKLMETFTVPSNAHIANRLYKPTSNIQFSDGSMRLFTNQVFEEGKYRFLLIPKIKDKETPNIDGCRSLKLSEYYALKEEAEEMSEAKG